MALPSIEGRRGTRGFAPPPRGGFALPAAYGCACRLALAATATRRGLLASSPELSG